jgi:hypothetical protein
LSSEGESEEDEKGYQNTSNDYDSPCSDTGKAHRFKAKPIRPIDNEASVGDA